MTKYEKVSIFVQIVATCLVFGALCGTICNIRIQIDNSYETLKPYLYSEIPSKGHDIKNNGLSFSYIIHNPGVTPAINVNRYTWLTRSDTFPEDKFKLTDTLEQIGYIYSRRPLTMNSNCKMINGITDLKQLMDSLTLNPIFYFHIYCKFTDYAEKKRCYKGTYRMEYTPQDSGFNSRLIHESVK